MELAVPDIILDKRLKWLGHLGRMEDGRLPKRMLFGEMKGKRPRHGAKRRRRDVIVMDLKTVSMDDWHQQCQERESWRVLCRDGERK